MSYPTPVSQGRAEIEIKKSRFISYAEPVNSREEAMEFLQQLKEKYPDARHHCWAYVLGNPNNAASAGMGDDGEPTGTAGKPILNVLQHKGVGDLMLVVVRYFGGIKLGAGGLTRAYGQAAQAVMEVLEVEEFKPQIEYQISCDFSEEQAVRHQLETLAGSVLATDYSSQVLLKVSLPEKAENEFAEFLANRQISGKPI